MSENDVIEQVVKRLSNQHPGGLDLEVVRGYSEKRGETWYIPVRPNQTPRSTFEFYDALAEVETQLALHENVKVWLVPNLPNEEPTLITAT